MTKKISFELPAELVADAASGILIGEFNNWNPDEAAYLKKQQDGSMKAELVLTAGKTYEYRYLLSDGRWVNDGNAKTFSHLYGNTVENCIVNVPEVIKKATPERSKTVKKIKEATPVVSDDLTKIEGVGKKIAALLITENIKTFKALAKCTVKKLQLVLEGAGTKFSLHDPTTWPKQAKLAAAGKWEELKQWQEEGNRDSTRANVNGEEIIK